MAFGAHFISIRNADPDPDPGGKFNADPSGYGSGSETLLLGHTYLKTYRTQNHPSAVQRSRRSVIVPVKLDLGNFSRCIIIVLYF